MEFLKLGNTSAKFLSVLEASPEQGLPLTPHDALSSTRLVAGPTDATENRCVASSTHGGPLESPLALCA